LQEAGKLQQAAGRRQTVVWSNHLLSTVYLLLSAVRLL
jgi:hypothetical protein